MEGKTLDIPFGYEPEKISNRLHHLQKEVVKNCKAYSSFQSIGSDHRVVIARVKLSLRTSRTPKRVPVPDWSKLKTGTSLQERYSVEVKNRFDLLEF